MIKGVPNIPNLSHDETVNLLLRGYGYDMMEKIADQDARLMTKAGYLPFLNTSAMKHIGLGVLIGDATEGTGKIIAGRNLDEAILRQYVNHGSTPFSEGLTWVSIAGGGDKPLLYNQNYSYRQPTSDVVVVPLDTLLILGSSRTRGFVPTSVSEVVEILMTDTEGPKLPEPLVKHIVACCKLHWYNVQKGDSARKVYAELAQRI